MQAYDVIIIGAGHNGLTCAAYLAMAGLKVKILERRSIVGGAAVTEEFLPGFRNSTAAYTVSLLNPKVIADLQLPAHGLKIVERRAQNFVPALDGRYLLASEGRTRIEVAKHSRVDGERYDAFERELDAVANLLREFVLQAAPNLTRGLNFKSLRELLKAGRLGNRIRRLSTESLGAMLDLFTRSAGDYLDGWFEGDLVKALFGFDSIVGNYASPYAPGTAYVLLHHAFGEVNGKKRAWGHAIGGMGAISEAMARAASSFGVEITTDAPVREVLIEKGRAAGAVLAGGDMIRAKMVAANVNPKLLYTALVPESVLPAAFLRRMQGWRCGSGTLRMNVALSELPCLSARALRRRGTPPGAAGPRRGAWPHDRGPSRRRHHPGAEPCLHGPCILRRTHARMESRTHHRDAHPVHCGRHARSTGGTCRKPVLSACRSAITGERLLERSSGGSRRPHDRNG